MNWDRLISERGARADEPVTRQGSKPDMRFVKRLGVLVASYLLAWAATATLGVDMAERSAIRGSDPWEVEGWSASSPAPFLIVAEFSTVSGGWAVGKRARVLWFLMGTNSVSEEDMWRVCGVF